MIVCVRSCTRVYDPRERLSVPGPDVTGVASWALAGSREVIPATTVAPRPPMTYLLESSLRTCSMISGEHMTHASLNTVHPRTALSGEQNVGFCLPHHTSTNFPGQHR